jgi:hypothetical protein
MGYFKLKSGAFTTGEGKDLKFYTANDPTNNVVQSDQNLEQRFPEMFQEVEQPPSPQRAVGMYGIEKPPPPATPEEAQLQAILLQPITREEMKARADKLRQMADALEQRSQEGQQASQQDQTAKEWQQAAQEHGQTPTVQTDDPMRPGRSTPGVPMQGPGQAPVPPQQQRERDLQQAKDLEQKGRAEQEQVKADQIAQQRQQAQGQQGQQSPPQGSQGQPQQTAKQEMKLRYAALPPAQQREEDVKLERATVEQLRAVAEEEEVEVPKNASKAQLIQAIRQNRK